MTMDKFLHSNDKFTKAFLDLGIDSWEKAINHVRQIPYGRNANRLDFELVVVENKGTCSSKHALLKTLADYNKIPNVELIIGIYKMTESNTKIGKILSQNQLQYIPEAHCYLKINGIQSDNTSPNASFETIKDDLLEEISIQPKQVGDFKIDYHQNFIKNWLFQTNSNHNFEYIWNIREKCIAHLSNQK